MLSQNPPAVKEPPSLYYTEADTLGHAYVSSLERFVADLDPGLKKHVSDYINRISNGARQLSDDAYKYIQNPEEHPKTVDSTWGQLELDKLIEQAKGEADSVLKAAELLSIRGDLADVSVLVTPIVQSADIQAEMASFNAKSIIELEEENKQDITELETLMQARQLLAEKEVPEEEKVIAERIRKRLVSLVQRAPKSEYVAPQQATPKKPVVQPASQMMQMNPQILQQQMQQMQQMQAMQMSPQMFQMLQMQQQAGQPLTPQQQNFMMMFQQQQMQAMQAMQQMMQMNPAAMNLPSNQMMQQQMQNMQMQQAMAMANKKQQGQPTTPVQPTTAMLPVSQPASPAQPTAAEPVPTDLANPGKRKRDKN